MIKNKFSHIEDPAVFYREIQLETGRIIRDARRRKGLSIVKAARLLKISPFSLRSLEAGTVGQPVCEIARIVSFYGYGITEFHDLDTGLLLLKVGFRTV